MTDRDNDRDCGIDMPPWLRGMIVGSSIGVIVGAASLFVLIFVVML
jgi:hypothetical protein